MKRLLKNKKALSPVVAAIILIAVTVAVSIAVAAWMGSLTIGFMETAEVTITDATFNSVSSADDTITVEAINTGTSAATVASAKVNGNTFDITFATTGGSMTISAGGDETFTVTDTGFEFTAGTKYSISLFATDGSLLSSYTTTA